MEKIKENFLDLNALEQSETLLWLGFEFTVKLVVVSFLLALVLGGFVTFFRTRRSRISNALASAYIDVMRATPPLVSLVIVYYVLPEIFGGFSLSTYQAAVLTFAVVQAAYIGEIYRGGMIAIDRGQTEAARSLGLSPFQAARLVLIPQVVRVVIPPLTSQATQVVRDSSLAFIIGYPELLTRAREAQNLTSNSTPLVAAALMYVVLLLGLQIVSARIEKQNELRTAT